DRDDGGVLELPLHPHLAREALARLLRGSAARVHGLLRHLAADPPIPAEDDLAHPPSPQELDALVAIRRLRAEALLEEPDRARGPRRCGAGPPPRARSARRCDRSPARAPPYAACPSRSRACAPACAPCPRRPSQAGPSPSCPELPSRRPPEPPCDGDAVYPR